MKIELDENAKAFYKGVGAGDDANRQLKDIPEGATFEQRLQYYWLRVGAALATSGIDDENVIGNFVAGAMTRVPERRAALVLVLGTDVGNLVRHAARVAEEIDSGATEGKLYGQSGHVVGTYTADFDLIEATDEG